MTIAEFLLAEIAKDVAVAEAAAQTGQAVTFKDFRDVRRPHWGVNGNGHLCTVPDDAFPPIDATESYDERNEILSEKMIQYLVCNDPARVLAECEAKRQLIEQMSALADGSHLASSTGSLVVRGVGLRGLATMALPYADRPGYQREWAL